MELQTAGPRSKHDLDVNCEVEKYLTPLAIQQLVGSLFLLKKKDSGAGADSCGQEAGDFPAAALPVADEGIKVHVLQVLGFVVVDEEAVFHEEVELDGAQVSIEQQAGHDDHETRDRRDADDGHEREEAAHRLLVQLVDRLVCEVKETCLQTMSS